MGTTKKASKGSVSLQQLPHTRRFKYRYQQKVYYLTLPREETPVEATVKHIIELDMLQGTHDDTLAKYKTILTGGSNMVPPKKPPVIEKTSMILHASLLDFFERSGRSLQKDLYHATYRMTVKWGDQVTIEDIPALLNGMKYSSKTFNNRKMVLNSFCEWMLKRKLIDLNPLSDIPSRRKTGIKSLQRRRLTDDEIKSILAAIKDDRYVLKNSHRFRHSDYYPIFYFLAATGVRPAEAIGLQVKKVDFMRNVILIDQSLARTRSGTSSANRRMKSTKMDDWREIPLGEDTNLKNLLKSQCEGKGPSELVFTSPLGLACDDRKMNDSVLKPVLNGLEIPMRVLYAFRHSFISRCFERGMDIKSVQSLTGHKDLTILLNTYAEVTKQKVPIPTL